MSSPVRAPGTKLLAALLLLLVGLFSLTAVATALADDPPAVVTAPGASASAATTATVGGSVDPHGSAVSDCHVEYSTDMSYTYKSACAPDPGAGSGAVAVSAALTDLQPGTTYHFRLVATNAGGTAGGDDATFTTAQPPVPIVTTGGVAGFDVGNATVKGTINPNGSNASCKVEYGPTTNYDESKLCDTSLGAGTTPVDVQALLTGLVPGQTIHYRFVSTNDAGTAMGADQTLFTPAIVGSQRPTGGSDGGSGGSGGGRRTGLVLPASARVSFGRVTLTLRCFGAPCRGTLKLTARAGRRTFTVGTLRVALRRDEHARATIRLTAKARAELRRHRRGLTVTGRGAGARTTIRLRL
jgi:hypothetical protein